MMTDMYSPYLNGSNPSSLPLPSSSTPNTQVQPQEGHHPGNSKRKMDDMSSKAGEKKKSSQPPNGKKTKGRVKIKMEFIDNKLRRYTTFSKRKTGIMKKV